MFKVKFDYVVWSNANGVTRVKSGGKELRHARKLLKEGRATIKAVDSRFLGYGRSTDSGTSAITYEVTIKG
jgi:hypothetical protein